MNPSLRQRLIDFWVKPIRPEPLALFRILLGTVMLLSNWWSWAPLDRYIGPAGLAPVDGYDEWLEESGRFCLTRGPINLPFLNSLLTREQIEAWQTWGENLDNFRLLMNLWLVAIAFFTVGLFTRSATVVTWALAVTFHNRLNWFLNGGDALFRNALFYLIFSRAGAAWSLDNLVHRRENRAIPSWPVRLLQIQFCLIYLATGVVKLNEDWLRGTAVYWVLNDMALTRWSYCQIPLPVFLCQVASWGTILFEIGFSFLVMVQKIRPWLLLAGLTLHLGIWAATEIGWFSQITLCWYALFLSPALAERILSILTGRWFLRRSVP